MRPSLWLPLVLSAALALPLSAAPPTRDELCRELSGGGNSFFAPVELPTEPLAPGAELDLARRLVEQGRFDEAMDRLEPLLGAPDGGPTPDVDQRRLAHWTAGLAALRLAETRNCPGHEPDGSAATPGSRNPEGTACIVPLRAGAVHRDPTAARRALEHFLAVLRLEPRDPRAAWLANLAAALGNLPEAVPEPVRLELRAPDRDASDRADADGRSAVWRNVAPALGLDIEDLAGGAALEDFDGDGRLDLLTSTWDPCGGLRAFRNLGADGFRDVTAEWGLAEHAGGLNLFTADVDGDGRMDVFVTRGAWLLGDGAIDNSLLRNEPGADGPRFSDVTVELGLDLAAPTQAAVFADFDGDHDLDLYVGNEATAAHPHASHLFRNDVGPDGRRRFVEIGAEAGVTNLRYAKAVSAGDVDGDGDQDLYVSNFGLNRLYLNRHAQTGELRFVDEARELGVTEPAVQSFATWFFDADADGDLDLFVADYRQQPDAVAASLFPPDSPIGRQRDPEATGRPLLYRNLLAEHGHLGFEEVGRAVGLVRPAMPMGANFDDLDGDGTLDLYLGTGEPDLASQFPNQAWALRDGRYVDVTAETGLGHLQKGHGVAFGDVDGDGDVDLLHQLGGFYPGDPGANALFLNPSTDRGNRWITLRLLGDGANRFGVGARVRIVVSTDEGSRNLWRWVGTGGSFGASSHQLEVGLGASHEVSLVVVDWPGGESVGYRHLQAGRIHVLPESVPAEADGWERIPLEPWRFPLPRPEGGR